MNVFNDPDRTLELSDLGVNLTTTFNQLLSPEGIVNQFSLSVILQVMFVVESSSRPKTLVGMWTLPILMDPIPRELA